MSFFVKILTISLISAISCFSQQSTYEAVTDQLNQAISDLNGTKKTGLLKSSNSTMTSYTNSTFNFRYTAPTGWSFDAPQVFSDGVTITATNPLYSANVFISVIDRLTSVGAMDYSKSTCFKSVCLAYKNRTISEPAPLIIFAADTFYTELNYGYAWILVECGQNSDIIIDQRSSYNSRFAINVQYVTTSSDHTLNTENYFQNVLGTNFITLTPTLAKNSISEPRSSISLAKSGANSIKIYSDIQRDINLTMYDLAGRKVTNLYSGPAKESITLPQSTSNTYLIQLNTAKEKCTMNANIIK